MILASFRQFSWLLIMCVVLSLPARAHFADRYGLGVTGTAASTATAGRCEFNAHAAYVNPALLACDGKASAEFSYVYAFEKFKSISNIRTSGTTYPTNPDAINTTNGSVSTDYPNHQAFELGAHLPILPQIDWLKRRNAQLGFSLHLNADHMMSINSGFAYSPNYSLYENRDHRYFASMGAGLAAIDDRLWLGLGGEFYFTTGASTVVVLSQTNPMGQFAVDVDPAVALIASLRARPVGDWPFFVSLIYHQQSDQTMRLRTRSDVTFGTGSIPLIFNGEMTLYSEPHRLFLSLAYEAKRFSVETGVLYALWQQIRSPRPFLDFESLVASDSLIPANTYRNTASSHTAASYKLSGDWDIVTLLAGFSFEPSVVKTNSGPENEIDTDKTRLGLGVMVEWPLIQSRFGLGYQWQHLLSKTVTKTDATTLGYPGYDIGGNVHAVQVGVLSRW